MDFALSRLLARFSHSGIHRKAYGPLCGVCGRFMVMVHGLFAWLSQLTGNWGLFRYCATTADCFDLTGSDNHHKRVHCWAYSLIKEIDCHTECVMPFQPGRLASSVRILHVTFNCCTLFTGYRAGQLPNQAGGAGAGSRVPTAQPVLQSVADPWLQELAHH